jgi:hypothetical protein
MSVVEVTCSVVFGYGSLIRLKQSWIYFSCRRGTAHLKEHIASFQNLFMQIEKSQVNPVKNRELCNGGFPQRKLYCIYH